MLMAGINFVLHFRLLTGRAKEVWRDAELRYFLGVIVGATVILFATVHEDGARLADSLRHAAFQTVSILTTTGYCTTDFETWATLPLLVLLCLMVLGGMSGSTGGGIKSLRALLAISSLRTTLHRLIHPHAVRPVKYGGAVVSESVLSGIWSFLTAYLLIALIGTAVVAAHGYDLLTAISAGLTSIGNVGPGLGQIGAYDNFAHFPGLVKIVLAGCMLFGRLEVFTLLALLSREFWRR
jgi:trk system potassium uptake protein TrkH